MDRAGRFAYNVGVNVIANLVAAGIIYLLAAAVGLFKPNPALVAVAVSAILLLGGLATVFVGNLFADTGKGAVRVTGLGLFLVTAAIWTVGGYLVTKYGWLPGFLFGVMGLFVASMATFVLATRE